MKPNQENKSGILNVVVFMANVGGGGAEKTTLDLISKLSLEESLNLKLILADYKGAHKWQVDKNIEVINMSKSSALKALLPLFRYITKNKPDIVFSVLCHVNLIAIIATLLSRYIYNNKKTKVIVSERASISKTIGSIPLSKKYFVYFLMKVLYPFSDHIVGVSKGVVEEAKKMNLGKLHRIRCIYNGINVDVIDKERIINRNIHKFMQSKNPLFIAVGRLVEQKRIDRLINGFSLLRKRTKANLLILGEGPLRFKLQKLIEKKNLQDCIEMVGFQKKVIQWINNSDIYILTSDFEGLPGALIQAMACGLKLISVNCKYGPSEILQNGLYGTLVDIDNQDYLVNAMYQNCEIVNKEQNKRGLRTTNEGIDRFKIEHCALEYKKLFKEVVDS